MASNNLDVTGKDTRLTLTVGGRLVRVVDQVTSFEARAVYDEIQTKHLGRSGSRVQKVFVGWEGSIALTRQSAALDEFVDELNALRIAGTPYAVNLVETVTYRDLTSKTYLYPDVEVEFDRRTSRGEADQQNLPWKTGNNRVAS